MGMCGTGFAYEKYAFQDSEGVHIVTIYDETSTIEKELEKIGKSGANAILIKDENIIATRADRKYWKLNGSNIVVDVEKKQNDLDAIALQKAKRDAVLEKLKITEEELKSLEF
jgi:hypothetical protein